MKRFRYPFVVCVAAIMLAGCAAKEAKPVSAESSVIEAGKDVVKATGDALRGVAEGVNNAVYRER